MNKYRNFISLLGLLAISALLWWYQEPLVSISINQQISFMIGGIALTGFFIVFLLSARIKWIEMWFGGLEHVYTYHKYMAIFSVVSVFAHAILIIAGATEEHQGSFVAAMGLFSFLLFLLLTIVALVAKRMKYEHWRFFHRLLVIPYVMGIYHTYIVEEYNLFQLNALSLFVGITSIIGMASALYVIFFYQNIRFRNHGEVTAVNHLSPTVVELELSLKQHLEYEKGQYVFFKIKRHGFEKAPHPFSISGGNGNKIYLTIKVLGDYTQEIYNEIEVGTKIALDGPYGHMKFEKGRKNQVWVAGGIGIAPFISYLRDHKIENNVILYYSYRGGKEAVYKDFLENYANKNKNLKVIFNDTSSMNRFDFRDKVISDDSTVFMCGPVKMIKNYAKQISVNNRAEVIYEAFAFR